MSMPNMDAAAARKPELAEVMGELHAAVCALRQATDLLVERISPLSRPANPVATGSEMPESCTAVTQDLRVEISDLHYITDLIYSAYMRVEI